MSEIFTLLDTRHCQIPSSTCVWGSFPLISHTLSWLSLVQPLALDTSEGLYQEEACLGGENRDSVCSLILNAVFSLRWLKSFCSKNLTSVMQSQAMWGYSRFTAFSCVTIQFGVVLLGWCLLLCFGNAFGSLWFLGFGVLPPLCRRCKSNVAQQHCAEHAPMTRWWNCYRAPSHLLCLVPGVFDQEHAPHKQFQNSHWRSRQKKIYYYCWGTGVRLLVTVMKAVSMLCCPTTQTHWKQRGLRLGGAEFQEHQFHCLEIKRLLINGTCFIWFLHVKLLFFPMLAIFVTFTAFTPSIC